MRLDDGFSTRVDFADNPSVSFYEKTVTPPGYSAGGPNDTTTMRNTAWRTNSPKQLKTATESTLKVAYDPVVFSEILAMVGANQLITITFPEGDTLEFWGWIDEFTPDEIKEGEQPMATIKIQPSNQNDSGTETAPVYTAP